MTTMLVIFYLLCGQGMVSLTNYVQGIYALPLVTISVRISILLAWPAILMMCAMISPPKKE